MKPILLFCIAILSSLLSFSQTYTFTGNGYWTTATNWTGSNIPPSVLPFGSAIYISPAAGDTCILDIAQTISAGATLVISAGANFIITGGMLLNEDPEVTICSQVWTKKNLDVLTYRNGDTIPQVTDPVQWSNLTTGAWCYYNNDSATGSIYGKLYNWYAVNDPRGLAPDGWHIPSNLEWGSLLSCLGGDAVAGGPMKDTGYLHWNSPNLGATNSSGFTAYGGGQRDSAGVSFYSQGFNGFWWSSDSVSPGKAKYTYLYSYYEGVGRTDFSFRHGASIRCIKNTLPVITTVPPEVTATNTITGGIIASGGGLPIIAKGVVWSTSPNPSIALGTKTNDGTGIAFYNSYLTGLTAGSTYFLRAYATTSLGTGYGNEVSFVNSVPDSGILICGQNWMRTNLKVSTYRNGDPIPYVPDPTQWANLTTGAWCYYNNDPATASVYGKLYNWYAVTDPRGLAPAGWHIPSLAELTTLSACLGGDATSGGALKETGFAHWTSPNTGATNSSNFTALPGGYRYDDGLYYEINRSGFWWTTNSGFPSYANYLYLTFDSEYFQKPNALQKNGLSVRCLRD